MDGDFGAAQRRYKLLKTLAAAIWYMRPSSLGDPWFCVEGKGLMVEQ
jgi:hypothetical protein